MFVDHDYASSCWADRRGSSAAAAASVSVPHTLRGDHGLLRALPIALPVSLLLWATIIEIGHALL